MGMALATTLTISHLGYYGHQRCRSVFNIGGYNSAFLLFFRDFEILGGIFRFCRFSSFNDFENLGVYSGFNKNVLKQLKIRIRMHKINK